ncbi:MAG TPA: N-acetylmuramoyl-L-alanine amidase [Humisphaera sp.]
MTLPGRLALSIALVLLAGCQSNRQPPTDHVKRAAPAPIRRGDEIVVAGQLVPTGGARVVLWTDPGGYAASAKNIGTRDQVLSDAEAATVRAAGGRWAPALLREKVDQFVLHYDVAGTSRTCFRVLEGRGLSVHFMLDVDGTIYQTCDLQARTFHATKSNPRSVGVEIANMGAYANPLPLKEWYGRGPDGRTVLTIPARLGDGGVRDRSAVLRPDRDDLVTGTVHGKTYRQYDLTPQQYAALARLTATLATVFPRVTLDYPHGPDGKLVTTALTDARFAAFTGVLGHFHVQVGKQDPGPAMQWDRLIADARRLMSPEAMRLNDAYRGRPVTVRPEKATGAKPATRPL